MPDITEPVQVVAGNPVKASDHNTSSDAIVELTAALETLQNSQLINGSFEDDLSNWVASNIGGGSNSIEETTVIHGVKSFKAIATALGGYVDLDSDDFLLTSAGFDDVFIQGRIQVSGQVQVQGWIEWFDVDDISISTQQFMDHTFGAGELNAWLRFRGWGRAVATARSYKLSFQLGDGTVAGDIYLDGIKTRLNDPFPWIVLDAPFQFADHAANATFDDVVDPAGLVGIAYQAATYNDEQSVGAGTFYSYNVDTATWVALDNTAVDYPLDSIIGRNCDEDGALRVDTGTGLTSDSYVTAWR